MRGYLGTSGLTLILLRGRLGVVMVSCLKFLIRDRGQTSFVLVTLTPPCLDSVCTVFDEQDRRDVDDPLQPLTTLPPRAFVLCLCSLVWSFDPVVSVFDLGSPPRPSTPLSLILYVTSPLPHCRRRVPTLPPSRPSGTTSQLFIITSWVPTPPSIHVTGLGTWSGRVRGENPGQ